MKKLFTGLALALVLGACDSPPVTGVIGPEEGPDSAHVHIVTLTESGDTIQADAILGTQMMGVTPLDTVVPTSNAIRSLRLERPGWKTLQTEFAQDKEQVELIYRLEALPQEKDPNVEITVSARDAESGDKIMPAVAIAGEAVGRAPVKATYRRQEKQVSVTLTLDGYEPRNEVISLAQSAALEFVMIRKQKERIIIDTVTVSDTVVQVDTIHTKVTPKVSGGVVEMTGTKYVVEGSHPREVLLKDVVLVPHGHLIGGIEFWLCNELTGPSQPGENFGLEIQDKDGHVVTATTLVLDDQKVSGWRFSSALLSELDATKLKVGARYTVVAVHGQAAPYGVGKSDPSPNSVHFSYPKSSTTFLWRYYYLPDK